MSGSDLPGQNADIALRKRAGVLYAVPETRAAEEWLIERETSEKDIARPKPVVDSEGRVYGEGYKGAVRGFIVTREAAAGLQTAAEKAGLVVRRQHRR